MANARVDPFPRYNFLVEIDGLRRAGFMTCSGLEEETEVRDYREGGDNTTVRKLAGLNSYAPITLEMGSTGDSELWEWRQRIVRTGAQGNRKAITVIQQDEARREVKRWLILDAWPSKFTGPEFDASSSENAVESVEIQHEGLQLTVRPQALG